MKKTSKKLFALILAAMFILASVPFSASAALQNPTNDVRILGQKGVTYQLYKVADYSQQSGAYIPICQDTTDDVNKAIKSPNASTADVLAALDALTEVTTAYGTPVQGEFKCTDTSEPRSYEDLTDGLYYFKATKLPVDAESVTKNSVFVIPAEANVDGWCQFDVTSKVKMLGDVGITKKIVVSNGQGSTNEVDSTTSGHLDTVLFKLAADVTGSNENPLTKYMIADIMSDNLDAVNYSIESVRLVKNGSPAKYEILTSSSYDVYTDKRNDSTITSMGTGRYDFVLSFKSSVLDPSWKSPVNNLSFYDFDKVEVLYRSKIIMGATNNRNETNHDDLFYSNSPSVLTDTIEPTDSKSNGDTVNVKGFDLRVKKVDQNGLPLEGAEFALYATRDAQTGEVSNLVKVDNIDIKAVSDADGIAKFYFVDSNGRLDPTRPFLGKDGDTFYAVETKAPEGYNLNTIPVEITLNGTQGGQVNVPTVVNTTTKLPETGGAGTMMFTIIGAGLMLVAGVLFVVVYKKRSAK